MARPRKPARLWYYDADQTWCVLDAGSKRRLGLRKEQLADAERQLEAYLTARRSKEKPVKGRRADAIFCAEVLQRYVEVKGSEVKRPRELAQRVGALLEYWGEMTLDDVDGDSCRDFASEVGSASYARRCLEDFRAAVGLYAAEGFLRDRVVFTLPVKPQGRTDWLTVKEAIALCKTAWRYREVQRGAQTERWPTRHVVKFIAAGIATCSRSARIYEASYVPEPIRPFIDLEAGIYYRAAPDEEVANNKRAPPVILGERILRAMRRWRSKGDRYLVQYAGRPADCKKAFASTVARAKRAYPTLFRGRDGLSKEIVRHTLRHTGITWLAIAGVDPYEICKYAGLSMETFERVYSHHHPAYMSGVRKAQARRASRLEETPPVIHRIESLQRAGD